MKDIDTLAWLCVQDGRVLCARSKGRGAYYLPGGKREPGESDREALAREIREELSVELVPETMRRVGAFEAQADAKPAGTVVRVTCYRAEHRGEIAAAAEIEEVRWLGHGDRGLCSAVGRLILDWLKENGLIA